METPKEIETLWMEKKEMEEERLKSELTEDEAKKWDGRWEWRKG